tara:strand:- start:2192 stop:2668 length:477 start_codon:yes stop_codon:yes gene_type:complete
MTDTDTSMKTGHDASSHRPTRPIVAAYGCLLAAFLVAVGLGIVEGRIGVDWLRGLSLATLILLVATSAIAQFHLYRSRVIADRLHAQDLTSILVRLAAIGILAAFDFVLLGMALPSVWTGLFRIYTWTIGFGALLLTLKGFWSVTGGDGSPMPSPDRP